MNEQDKLLLLKVLCVMFPHGVRYNYGGNVGCDYTMKSISSNAVDDTFPIEDVKPYLRKLSSMTEEEYNEYQELYDYEERSYNQGCEFYDEWKVEINDEVRLFKVADWLNAHYFDYYGLIEKGLALEAPEGMYNI